MRVPSGVTDQYLFFIAVDATDLKTRETGLSDFTVYRARDGAAAAAMTTPTTAEVDGTNMPGVFRLLMDEDMTIGAGNDTEEMVFHIEHASMSPVTRVIELYRPKITAGYTLGAGSDGDLLEVNTLTGQTVQTADHTASIATVDNEIAAMQGNVTDILADTNELQVDDIPGKITALDAVVDTVKAETVLILADTNELQGDDIPGKIDALDAVVDTVKVDTAAILTDTGTTLVAQIAALENMSTADLIASISEGGHDLQGMLRIMFAVLAGKSTGGGTLALAFRDVADSKNRVAVTVDSDGNRDVVTTLDGE